MPTTDRIEINPQVMLGCHGNLQGSTIGMRRAAASLMLGWLVLLGRAPHVFAIPKVSGEGAGRAICGVMGAGRES